MTRDELESWLKRTILELQDSLSIDQVVPSASLFHDLGFDSLTFEKLIARVEASLADQDLTPWYARAARGGEDTVGSLLEFLLGERVAAQVGGP
jgi:Phosphopantetheine attachment site